MLYKIVVIIFLFWLRTPEREKGRVFICCWCWYCGRSWEGLFIERERKETVDETTGESEWERGKSTKKMWRGRYDSFFSFCREGWSEWTQAYLLEFDLAGFEGLYHLHSFNCETTLTWMEVWCTPTTHCYLDFHILSTSPSPPLFLSFSFFGLFNFHGWTLRWHACIYTH